MHELRYCCICTCASDETSFTVEALLQLVIKKKNKHVYITVVPETNEKFILRSFVALTDTYRPYNKCLAYYTRRDVNFVLYKIIKKKKNTKILLEFKLDTCRASVIRIGRPRMLMIFLFFF